MALGGGTWTAQNKPLPGSYINFSSLQLATPALSARGIVAAPMALDWGPEETIFSISAEDLRKNCKKIFSYEYTDAAMLPVRELFRHATTVLFWRLGSGSAEAENDFAAARYGGARGNALKTVISANVDDDSLFDVQTWLDGVCVDTQTVAAASGLVDNDYVVFKKTATLATTAGTALTGGEDATVDGAAHQAFLSAAESYSFNVLCCPASDSTTVALYTAYTIRMRDEIGAKFQLVAWHAAADHEGVIGVWNAVSGTDSHALVYWVAGAEAATVVSGSLTNATYDGELTVTTAETQAALAAAIAAGKFMLHRVNGTVRVLRDINSLVTVSSAKGEIFKANQTVRVCDEIAIETSLLFNEQYAGQVLNNADGRAALWNDVVTLLHGLESIGAIQGFEDDIVSVQGGDAKESVLLIVNGLNVVNAMEKLYMSVVIR